MFIVTVGEVEPTPLRSADAGNGDVKLETMHTFTDAEFHPSMAFLELVRSEVSKEMEAARTTT